MVILPGRRTRFGGNDSYTKLLLHFDGEDEATSTVDSSSAGHTHEAFAGNAQLDTAQKKFGASSLLLDGTLDSISFSDHADWYFGTGDFTVDGWFRWNALPGTGVQMALVTQRYDASNYWALLVEESSGSYIFRMSFVDGGNYKINLAATTSLSAGEWYHLAFVRGGTSGYIFLSGTPLSVTGTQPGSNDVGDTAQALSIGYFAGMSSFNGWIDELRISKGIARWTSNFSPPVAPYN